MNLLSKTILLVFISIALAHPAYAQTAPDNTTLVICQHLYPEKALTGKGLLYHNQFELDDELMARSNNLINNFELKLALSSMACNDLNNFNNELVLRVLAETSDEYLISSCYDMENAKQNKIFNQKISLNKVELEEKGFKYISLSKLHQLFITNSQFMDFRNLGMPLTPDKALVQPQDSLEEENISRWPKYARIKRQMLRKFPDNNAEFVDLIMPEPAHPLQVNALDKISGESGDWLFLKVKFRFKYNAACQPNMCAMAIYQDDIEGWWEVPYDHNRYPWFLLALLKQDISWESAAAAIAALPK